MATSTSSAGRQNSRFSTFNVFKLPSSSKAPPPPPKDPYYLANPSLVSLSQPAAHDPPSSYPTTPASSGYASSARSPSPSPSYSTSQYTPSTHHTSPPTTGTLLSPEPVVPKRSKFKLPSFTRRPKTPRSISADGMAPPEPTDDSSISVPWNFQHNIHVDEGLSGLPPTWSAALQDLGYSQEEVDIISARRAAARSPTLIPTQNPQNFHVRTESSTSSAMPRPQPRSSSLQRDMSDDGSSMRSRATRPSLHTRDDSDASRAYSVVSNETRYDQVVYVRPTARSPETPLLRSRAGSANTPPGSATIPSSESPTLPIPRQHHTLPSTPVSGRSPGTASPQGVRTPYTTSPLSHRQFSREPEPQSLLGRIESPAPQPCLPPPAPSEKDRPPQTPPRRYHVANDSISTVSSPPPYKSPPHASTTFLSDRGDDANATSVAPINEEEAEAEDGGGLLRSLPTISPRLPAAAPRLSLHQDNLSDLSSWTESLFSIIPNSETTSSPPKSLLQSQPPSLSLAGPRTSSPSSSRPLSHSRSAHNLTTTSSTPPRQLPPQKPPPISQLPSRDNLPPSCSPDIQAKKPSLGDQAVSLWNEVTNTLDLGDDADLYNLPIPSPYREKENRDSSLSTITVTPATIVRDAAIVTRARANVIQQPIRNVARPPSSPGSDSDGSDELEEDHSNSSSSSESQSSRTSVSAKGGSSGAPQTNDWKPSPDLAIRPQSNSIQYVESSPLPSPLAGSFGKPALTSSAVRQYESTNGTRPSVLVQDAEKGAVVSGTPSPSSSRVASPLPTQLQDWVQSVVAPIRDFITKDVNPRDVYVDLQEVAEGESGSVFAARVINPLASGKPQVAIKSIPLSPSGTPKVQDLRRELLALRNISHPNVLSLDALYLDADEDALWVRMELMDRSLADIIGLSESGVIFTERQMAQVAKDVLSALDHLRRQGIAHRDVRSDNLLVSPAGFVKLADFSNAVQVPQLEPTRSDPVGVHYWQAPEIRHGPYNALKVDVWSLGATVWEMAQSVPPFSDATDLSQLDDRWPPLSEPENYSRSLHDFLHSCSEPSASRPDPTLLLNSPFIRNAGGRSIILALLSQCRSIETSLRRQSADSNGTVS